MHTTSAALHFTKLVARESLHAHFAVSSMPWPSFPPRYKWTQNQSHVYLYTRLPPGLHAGHVRVELAPDSLRVIYGAPRDEEPYLYGKLYGMVKAEASTWFIGEYVKQPIRYDVRHYCNPAEP